MSEMREEPTVFFLVIVGGVIAYYVYTLGAEWQLAKAQRQLARRRNAAADEIRQADRDGN